MENNSFGYIVSIYMKDFNIPKDLVIKGFTEADIEESFHPKERMPRKAMQKALQEAIEGEEGMMIRPVMKKGALMSSGLVQEHKDMDNRNLKYDVHNVITLNSELEVIESKNDFRTESIRESYKDHKSRLGSVEVDFRLKQIFFHSMAIDILCDTCYFVPFKFKNNIDRIVRLFDFLREMGADVRISVVGVDSGGQTRNTIVQEFSVQTLKTLEKEIKYCKEQRQKYETGVINSMRVTSFRKLQDKIRMLDQRLRTYVVLLSLTPEEDKPILEKLEELENEIGKNIEIAEVSRGMKKPSKKISFPNN